MRQRHLRLSSLTLLLGLLGTVPAASQTPGQHNDADRAPFLNDYIGQYRLTDSFRLDITRVGDALYVQGTGQNQNE